MQRLILAGLLTLGTAGVSLGQYPFVPSSHGHRHHGGFVPRPVQVVNFPVVRPVVVSPLAVRPLAYPVPAVVPQPLPAFSPEQAAQQINAWYTQYLQRPVEPEGLQTHVQVFLTQGPEVSLSGILGSEEYFQICGQEPQSWVVSLYVNVLGRQPAVDEVQNWFGQLFRQGGDRQRLALQFLIAARVELSQR